MNRAILKNLSVFINFYDPVVAYNRLIVIFTSSLFRIELVYNVQCIRLCCNLQRILDLIKCTNWKPVHISRFHNFNDTRWKIDFLLLFGVNQISHCLRIDCVTFIRSNIFSFLCVAQFNFQFKNCLNPFVCVMATSKLHAYRSNRLR